MNNLFVFCELDEGRPADVSLELLTRGRSLANTLGCRLEAVVLGSGLDGIENELFPYGADVVHVADDPVLEHYRTLPYTSVITGLFRQEQPGVALMGATSTGRDLGPRVSSALHSGLTADCTSLEIGDHYVKKTDTTYKNLLYQIRPAFGGNIIATIINPDHRPQMATVREGVMKREIVNRNHRGELKKIDVASFIRPEDLAVEIIERHMEARKVDIKSAQIIVSGGYGMGSKENFALLYELASVLGGEVAASRAAVDAGYAGHERQVGQTGVTVRPKLYIACGISGQIQHTAGMNQSGKIIAINNDPMAPINSIADYVINGDVPPLSGFIGKFAIFASLVEAYQAAGDGGLFLLLLIIIGGLNTAISLFYYLRVVKIMTIDEEPRDRRPFVFSDVSLSSAFLWIITLPTLGLIINWEGLNRLAIAAAQQLF